MNFIEGQISITLHPDAAVEKRVSIKSSRPVYASKVLIGKTPEQALSIIPMLFSICGAAQSRAALQAIQQQLKLDTNSADELARDIIVLSETAKEHLLRIFLDWPKLFSLETKNQHLPYLGQLVGEFKNILFAQGDAFSLHSEFSNKLSYVSQLIDTLEAYLQEQVFCTELSNWLSFTSFDELCRWAEQSDCIAAQSVHAISESGWTSQGMSKCSPLPTLDKKLLLARFNAEDAGEFILSPQWLGNCHETTSLSRQFAHPLTQELHQEFDSSLITRWVARLTELALIPEQMRRLLQNIESDEQHAVKALNEGVSQVEAARGRLIHRVVINTEHQQQKIDEYQILAPTEWNFHPQGLVAQSLSNINARDEKELAFLAKLMINAIDPCVGYQLSIQ